MLIMFFKGLVLQGNFRPWLLVGVIYTLGWYLVTLAPP